MHGRVGTCAVYHQVPGQTQSHRYVSLIWLSLYHLLQHVEHVPDLQAAGGRGEGGRHVLAQGEGTALPAHCALGGGHVGPGVAGGGGGSEGRVGGWIWR